MFVIKFLIIVNNIESIIQTIIIKYGSNDKIIHHTTIQIAISVIIGL